MECVHGECDWRCRAILCPKEQYWEIMKLKGSHTCVLPLISKDHNKLGSRMISQTIREVIEVNPPTPISITIAHIKSIMGYTINYRKATIRWGLVESINLILKKTRKLPIFSMVMETYTCCNKFFVKRGRKVDAMINVGHVYSEVTSGRSLTSKNVPGLLKIRHIGQTTLGSAAIFGLFLGAGSLIHCGKSY
uniref:Uncharacterized protein n=1 Tax=Cajanus cajan TaxID=3821 RepID=A0A151RQN8_CAJCA|nr:hypothetical protein KK1_033605 [Cajanus cajan]